MLDITAVNAVQSLFLKTNHRDPWAEIILPKFIDFVIWSDKAKYSLIFPEKLKDDYEIGLPPLFKDITRRDSDLFNSNIIVSNDRIVLDDDILLSAFAAFKAYTVNNKERMKKLIDFHKGSFVPSQLKTRDQVYHGYFFNTPKLLENNDVHRLATTLGVPADSICYTFDMAVKYLKYGEFSENGYYLSHPVREQIQWTTFTKQTLTTPPHVPLPLGLQISQLVKKMDQDQFTALLHEARGIVRDMEMAGLPPDAIEPERRRELAFKLGLPAKLKTPVERKTFEDIVKLSVPRQHTIVSRIWSTNLPRYFARKSWLQWAIRYDLEEI